MSKGSKARPFAIPLDEFGSNFDRIFKHKLCGTCRKPVDKCGCMPTDDGPGQDGEDKGEGA